MKARVVLLKLVVTTGFLVGLTLLRKSPKDDWKAFVLDAVARNHAISVASSNAFGRHAVHLGGGNGWVSEMRAHLKIENEDDAPNELIERLLGEAVLLINAYANGSFNGIVNFYLGDRLNPSTNVLINSNRVWKIYYHLRKQGKDTLRVDCYEDTAASKREEERDVYVAPCKELLDMCA